MPLVLTPRSPQLGVSALCLSERVKAPGRANHCGPLLFPQRYQAILWLGFSVRLLSKFHLPKFRFTTPGCSERLWAEEEMPKEGRSEPRRPLSSSPHLVTLLCCPDRITHPKDIGGLAIAIVFL